MAFLQGSNPDVINYVSIYFGTSQCTVATGHEEHPDDIKLFEALERCDNKWPLVLLLDPCARFVSFGQKAKDSYERKCVPNPDRADDYLLFQNFKMHLYETPVGVICIVSVNIL